LPVRDGPRSRRLTHLNAGSPAQRSSTSTRAITANESDEKCAARLAASGLLLGLGMGIVVQPPQQGVEQAEEEQDKTGGESGDPPAA
jgi:hypothetical protein